MAVVYESVEDVSNKLGTIHDPETEYLNTEVLDIFNNSNVEKYLETKDPKLMCWISTYYDFILHDNEKTKYFLEKAANLSDQNAINNLGCYYWSQGDVKEALRLFNLCTKPFAKTNAENIIKMLKKNYDEQINKTNNEETTSNIK